PGLSWGPQVLLLWLIPAQPPSPLSPGSRHATVKPGACPVVLRGSLGPCLELCDADGNCPGATKCCTTGCGHICKLPTKGKCPTVQPGLVGPCWEWCRGDNDCRNEQKCCKSSCGSSQCLLTAPADAHRGTQS
uniref:WAP domain-containing protein n=1 Tax=Falco tinnunculus TaxID=100819 RepID=A0A8C4TX70_FALTI